ncbi:hypothetical protein Tsubulata_048028, partial [Turnera subulata]
MMKASLFSLSVLLLPFHCTKTLAQAPAASPAQLPPVPPAKAPPADTSQAPAAQVQPSSGPLDVVKILTKAGRFTVFTRLLQPTGEDVELNNDLNNTNNGTASNPVRTQAGTGERTSLNVTTTGDFVNITTGLTNTSISGTLYNDNQLGIY